MAIEIICIYSPVTYLMFSPAKGIILFTICLDKYISFLEITNYKFYNNFMEDKFSAPFP